MVINWDQGGSSEPAPEKRIQAAMYVRMSTEHQKYSTDNQSTAIRRYAEKRNYDIVQTYADEGKSGLRLNGRDALKQLLSDVESGAARFTVILVYDVSRWGRFQDPDEAAAIELRCKRAGISVHYCAEQFENDGSIGSSIIKTVTHDVDDECPTLDEKPVTRVGDIWQLGRHRLLCGNARYSEEIALLMDGDIADMLFTDPPYNVPIDGHVSGLGRTRHREFAEACGEMSQEEFTSFLRETLRVAATSCRDGAIAYVCMDWRHLQELLEAGHSVFNELKNLCVWNKTNAGMGAFYRSQHELVLVWKNGTAPHLNTFGLGDRGRYRTNVWSYAGVNSFRADRMEELSIHPTVKPVAMVADAIRDVTHRSDLVLDTFGGSGTTLIAAERTGRRARLIEIDPAYCDVIVRRWERLTGKAAVLAATGTTFERTASLRTGWSSNAAPELAA